MYRRWQECAVLTEQVHERNLRKPQTHDVNCLVIL